jgi:multidrug efflux pump subunit AcrB
LARNQDGKMVPLDTLVDVRQISGPDFLSRFNLYLAAEIMGAPARGYSSAQALGAIEEVAKSMPQGFGYEWSGLTLQQKKSEGEAGVIFGIAIFFVFLLMLAKGSGAASRGVMGTAVVFGMTIATFAGIFLIPVCSVFIQSLAEFRKKPSKTVPVAAPAPVVHS